MVGIGANKWLAAVGCLLLAVGGCGRSVPRIEAPVIDATQAGREAVAEYDTNRDGVISGDELDRCPALKSALKELSKGTGKVTAADITERIRKWQEGRICMSPSAIQLTLDGKPLAGATVTAEPDKFLGAGIPTANGVTNSQGTAWPQVAQSRPGVFYGFYELHVSKKVGGHETIPARYNTQTELGFEKTPDARGLVGLKFELTSK